MWNGSTFVAVGYTGTILTSPDAVTWTSHAFDTSGALWDVTWNGSQFVVVGSYGLILSFWPKTPLFAAARTLGATGWASRARFFGGKRHAVACFPPNSPAATTLRLS